MLNNNDECTHLTFTFLVPHPNVYNIKTLQVSCKRHNRLFDDRDSYIDEHGNKITRIGKIEYYDSFMVIGNFPLIQSVFDSYNVILDGGKVMNTTTLRRN